MLLFTDSDDSCGEVLNFAVSISLFAATSLFVFSFENQ